MSITKFLLARISEDEEVAETCRKLGWFPASKYEMHAVSHARVLAECAAKRAIVEEHVNEGEPFDMAYCSVCMDRWRKDLLAYPCPTIAALAAVYADHDEYLDEWKVGA